MYEKREDLFSSDRGNLMTVDFNNYYNCMHHDIYNSILLGITSFKERRIRGDLIQFFKFHCGFELIDWHNQPITGERRIEFHHELFKNCDMRFH